MEDFLRLVEANAPAIQEAAARRLAFLAGIREGQEAGVSAVGKRVDVLTTWSEAAAAMGMDRRTLKAMHGEYLKTDLPMPIDVHGRRIMTTTAELQAWADRRAARARQGKNGGKS